LCDGVSKGRISILILLTLTLSRGGERESKRTLQRARGNYQVKVCQSNADIQIVYSYHLTNIFSELE
jgi:hypothetical protein